jgi:hypothetical protein
MNFLRAYLLALWDQQSSRNGKASTRKSKMERERLPRSESKKLVA